MRPLTELYACGAAVALAPSGSTPRSPCPLFLKAALPLAHQPRRGTPPHASAVPQRLTAGEPYWPGPGTVQSGPVAQAAGPPSCWGAAGRPGVLRRSACSCLAGAHLQAAVGRGTGAVWGLLKGAVQPAWLKEGLPGGSSGE
jgi:hypothetical protein